MNNFEITLTEKERSVRKMAVDVTHDIASYLGKGRTEDTSALVENIIEKLTKLLKEPIIIRNHHIISVEEKNGEIKAHELNNILTTMLLGFNFLRDIRLDSSFPKEQRDTINQRIEVLYTILSQETRTEGWDNIIREGTYELRRAIKSQVGDILVPLGQLTPSMISRIGLSEALEKGTKLSMELKKRMGLGIEMTPIHPIMIGEREGVKEITKYLDELLLLSNNIDSDTSRIAKVFLELKGLVENILDVLDVPDVHP